MRQATDRIKLRHLRTVLAIADSGSVTAAAQWLFVSQAAVSKTVAEVELLLGAELFQRSGRAIVPTEAGQRFIRTSRRVAAEMEVLDEEISLLASGGTGLLRVGLQLVSGHDLLVKTIGRLKQHYPETVIQLKDGILPELLQDLRHGSLDLVLGRMVPALVAPDLLGVPVAVSEPYIVVTSVNHPILSVPDLRWADLSAQAWCLPLRETPLRRHFDAFMAQQLLPQPLKSTETNSITMLLMLLQAMPLVAVAARSLAHEWAARGQVSLTRLTMLPQADPIGLIWSDKLASVPLGRFFRDEFLAIAKGEEPGEEKGTTEASI